MNKFYWRIVAIILTLVWVIVFFANIYFDTFETRSLTQKTIDNFVNAIPVFLSIILVVFPQKYIIYTILCCSLGIESLIYGSGINAYLMYGLGCLFAERAGILFRRKALTSILLIMPLCALASQYRFGISIILESFLELLFLLVLFSLSYVLIKEKLSQTFAIKATSAEQQKIISIDPLCLSEKDWDLVKEVLHDRTFLAIGKDRYKSESAIKKQMVKIYKKLGIKTKLDLFELHQRSALDFLDVKTTKGNQE